MDYKAAIDYIFSLEFFGIKLGLANIRKLLELCDHPEEQNCIQVAGTNGKGSVAAMLEAILMTAGKKTGLFTSPHLIEFSERMRINQAMIPRSTIAKLTEFLLPRIEQIAMMPDLAHPTYFEVNTAMALLYFQQEKTDWAILEVGMGGRLDATSAVTPQAVIITNVELEHTEYLGESIEEIAAEKAGTIKPGVPVFTTATAKALKIIQETCRRLKSPCFFGELLGRIIKNQPAKTGQLISIETPVRRYDDLFLPLSGAFQAENALLAVRVAEYFEDVSEAVVRKGLGVTKWPGRVMPIGQNPLTILDGAHNAAALEKLQQTVEKNFPHNNLVVVLAVLKDKNLTEILKAIISDRITIVVTQVSNTGRGLGAEELAAMIKEMGYAATVKTSAAEAVDYARHIAKADDLVLVCGSLYLVGEILAKQPLTVNS